MNETATSVSVEESGDGRYRQRITTGVHRLIADEPVAIGGDDAGPAPYDLLLAALGACTSMTLRMYAERKLLPLARVSVALRHERLTAENGEADERIVRVITLDGALDDAQRARLLEIANRCPVHRTLSGALRIDSRLAD